MIKVETDDEKVEGDGPTLGEDRLCCDDVEQGITTSGHFLAPALCIVDLFLVLRGKQLDPSEA
jgi:hypothetical protein